MQPPPNIHIDAKLWLRVRAAADRLQISPSEFLSRAFAEETERLDALRATGQSHPLGNPPHSPDALAELALPNALGEFGAV